MPKRSRNYVDSLIEDLSDPIMAEHYVNAALEESGEMFLLALRDVAEANRIAKVAEEAGLSRETLYRTLSAQGNPRLSSLTGILKAVGLQLQIKVVDVVPIVEHTEPSKSSGIHPVDATSSISGSDVIVIDDDMPEPVLA